MICPKQGDKAWQTKSSFQRQSQAVFTHRPCRSICPSAPKNLIADPLVSVMPEGQMFYSVAYGKNMMGSYASQLSRKQRWMVIRYIKNKQQQTKALASGKTVAMAVAK